MSFFTTSDESAVSKPRLRLRPLIIGGVLVIAGIVAGSLVAVNVLSSPGSTVWVLTKDVPAGKTVSTDDVASTRMTVPKGSEIYTDKQLSALPGVVATMSLPSGTVLSKKNVSTSVTVPDGYSLVSFSLASSSLPQIPLYEGQKVTLVEVPSAVDNNAALNNLFTVQATIFSVTQLYQGSSATATVNSASLSQVSVYVPSASAGNVAALASSKRIALAVDATASAPSETGGDSTPAPTASPSASPSEVTP